MMRHTSTRVTLLLVLAGMVACAQLGLLTPQSFREKLSAAVASVEASRSTTTMLLEAGRIGSDDAQHIQDQLENARAGLNIVRSMEKTAPATADAKLTQIRTGLVALEAYLKTKEK